MIALLKRVRADAGGAAIIEFGLLAPAILTLFIGVLQVGMWMQTHNALRSVAADTGRYVAVEYQKSNRINNIAMALWAHDRATDAYLFKDQLLSTTVVDASTQEIAGVTEKTLTINYTMTSFLGIADVGDINVSFSRPIFVKTS